MENWLAVIAIVFLGYCHSLLRPALRIPRASSQLLRHLAVTQPVANEVVAIIDRVLRGPEQIKKQLVYLTVIGLLQDRNLPVCERAVSLAVEFAWRTVRRNGAR